MQLFSISAGVAERRDESDASKLREAELYENEGDSQSRADLDSYEGKNNNEKIILAVVGLFICSERHEI